MVCMGGGNEGVIFLTHGEQGQEQRQQHQEVYETLPEQADTQMGETSQDNRSGDLEDGTALVTLGSSGHGG